MKEKNQVEKLIRVSKDTVYWVSEVISTVNDTKSGSRIKDFIFLQNEIDEKYNVTYQVFKPGLIISFDHLNMVLRHVEMAFLQGSNISKTPAFEFLLYLARVRQIKRAISAVGADLDTTTSTSVTFCEILFGTANNVEKAKPYLQKLTKSYNRMELNFVPLKSIATYLKYNNISDIQLRNFIQTADINIIPEKNGYDYLLKIPEISVRQAIVDCLAGYMITLFLENYRKTKGGVI